MNTAENASNPASTGFQTGLIETCWYGDEPFPAGDWQPIWRNGGPRDGERIGTALCDGQVWSLNLGRDEQTMSCRGIADDAVG